MLSPVTNLTVLYILDNNTVSVSWVDEENMVAMDPNATYGVSYNISVADILLISNSTELTPTNSTSTTFSIVIVEGDFLQAGVRVDVEVTVRDLFEESSAVIDTAEAPGGIAMI